MLVLVDHAADRGRIEAGEGAVHHHLRYSDLATHRFAAGLEVNRLRKAFLGFGTALLIEKAKPFGRGLGALVVPIDFALGSNALASFRS